MVRARQIGGLCCAAVAVLAVLVGWLQPAPDLTRADAVHFTAHALEAVGLGQVRVSQRVQADTYRARGSSDAFAVWSTSAAVAGGTIAMKVDRGLGQAVYVDDVAASGTKRLLSDSQFAALARVTTDPARHRRIARNVAGTVAGALVAGLALLATALVPRRLQEMPT